MPIICVFINTVLAQRWTRKKKDKERMALHHNLPGSKGRLRISHPSPATCSLFPHCSCCGCVTAVLGRGSSGSVYKNSFPVWSAQLSGQFPPWVWSRKWSCNARKAQPGWEALIKWFCPLWWGGRMWFRRNMVLFFRIVIKMKEIYNFSSTIYFFSWFLTNIRVNEVVYAFALRGGKESSSFQSLWQRSWRRKQRTDTTAK